MGVGRSIPGGCGLTPWKYYEGSHYVLTPWNVTSIYSKLLLDNSASFTSSRMKDVSKVKCKTNFWGACRLSGTGIVERNPRTIKRMAAWSGGASPLKTDPTDLDPVFYDRPTPLPISPVRTVYVSNVHTYTVCALGLQHGTIQKIFLLFIRSSPSRCCQMERMRMQLLSF